MPDTNTRSSKEWKALALQEAQQAEAQAQARQQYRIQLEEIQARMQEAEKMHKKHSEQAAIDAQIARNQEFEEISLVKQEHFRNTVAEEVFSRVAKQLKTTSDRDYILFIAEGQPDFENPTEFKAMLWEAIAGNDPAYLHQAAQKILERCGRPISEDDLNAIDNSVACLDRQAIISAWSPAEVSRERTDETSPDVTISVEEVGELSMDMPVETFEGTPEDQAPTTIDATTNGDLELSVDDVKQESSVHETRNAIDDIEIAFRPTIMGTAMLAEDNTYVDLTDPLGNIITGDDVVPQTPTRKRQMTEEGTPTPNGAGDSVTSKKRKTINSKNSARTPSAKFMEYMEDRGFTESDLLCSKCNKETKAPRVSKCYHVYCNKCLLELRQGVKGKEAHSVLCCHTGCDNALGAMSHVQAEAIQQLKKTLIKDDADANMAAGTEPSNV